MHRFYTDTAQQDRARLTPDDAHHAVHVLRLEPGSRVEIVSGGTRYAAELAEVSSSCVTARLLHPLPSTEPRYRITLFQGLPKGEKMDLIVQKAVELGVSRIVPLEMERSIVRLDGRGGEKKAQRWEKIAREAGKQSGRVMEVAVEPPCSFARFLTMASLFRPLIVPYENEMAHTLREAAGEADPALEAGILIGPEGGISPSEMEQLSAAGALPVTLGPRILRTETAGPAALACLMCLLGEMERGQEGHA